MRWGLLFKRKHKAESDVAFDPNTPSPAPANDFVGRMGGSDPGYSDETGAERRTDLGEDGPRSPDSDAR